MVFGALLLLSTDILAQELSLWIGQVLPSGVTAAAIGAPALIWFSRRQMQAQDNIAIALPGSRSYVSVPVIVSVTSMALLGLACYFLIQINEQSWHWALPSAYQWMLRWPRVLTALMTGFALALAGTILQRLIYNPLASPDILGVSAGATFALIVSSLFFGQSLMSMQWGTTHLIRPPAR